jgi:2-oxoglutarate dehydrogenase E1 component
MTNWIEFQGANAAYMLDLYEQYRRDPQSIAPDLRDFFYHNPPPVDNTAPAAALADVRKIVGTINYAEAIRAWGHLAARLDPLGNPPINDPTLDPSYHGVSEPDLTHLPAILLGDLIGSVTVTADEAIRELRAVYTSTIGYDYAHVREPLEREWLRHAAETRRFEPPIAPIDERALLKRLTEVEIFENFIHRIFPGKHRFSIEGLDMMVPMLDTMIGMAADDGITNILIGMAHRGRLNVLTHVLGKPYAQILAEFKDPPQKRKFREDLGWTGDVKYHMGATREMHEDTHEGEMIDVRVTMAPNPSHLEAVNPVVQGMARAAGTDVSHGGAPIFDPKVTLPILIHGDAAFPAQGVVAESLNLSGLPGYRTGGVMHIIANNQLGFTTDPSDARSTLYASELAKGFRMPIVHVNADDPIACITVARMALAYMIKFRKDFVIDLIGYRRYGHNEGDEPGFTQPVMYRTIETHPTVRHLWADTLVERGVLAPEEPGEMVDTHNKLLQTVLENLDPDKDLIDPRPAPPVPGTARRIKTAVSADRLRALNSALLNFPDGFQIHPKLQKAIRARQDILSRIDENTIDWATAEDLALASILEDGIAVRLTGQDSERGTYSQRHAVFHDYATGEPFVPLQALPQAQAAYEIHNSPLSEAAALGFEYGYNVEAPGRLVIWEAQYGDFINGGQTIIDEFIVSARNKFGQTPSLILLLPHGYEGAGPDHSSGRLERFLQLAADTNIRIANATTSAQYFHLLRRQAFLLETDPLPLVVMTPKSLLREKRIFSSLEELANGAWQSVIDDVGPKKQAKTIRRVILCSGKVYIDLVASPLREQNPDVAIIRVEQLYPFPISDLQPILNAYPNLEGIAWVQEEPENMGAWEFARPILLKLLGGKTPLHYVVRARNSSPAEGSRNMHNVNQAELIERAFTWGSSRQTASEKTEAAAP